MSAHSGWRAALFALTGVGFFAYWIIANPGYGASVSQFQWLHVLGFSTVLAALGGAIWVYGQMVGGRTVERLSAVTATCAFANSIANVLEDGFGVEWVFYAFVLATAAMLIGLLVLAALIGTTTRGNVRLAGFIPGGTAVAIVSFVSIGGPLMLTIWLAAAGVAMAVPERRFSEARTSRSSRSRPEGSRNGADITG